MSIDLGRRLIAAGLVSPEEVEAALFVSVARGLPFPRVLIDRGAISERSLESELDRVGGLGLRQVVGAVEVVKRLPRAMCRRLAALPTRVDPDTGAVDVAAADPLDGHVAAEIGFHLSAPIRVLRAPIAAIEEAIRRLELDEGEPAARARERRVTPPFPHGAPQSSIPPPPHARAADETPIPLVRRIAVPSPEEPKEYVARTGGTLVPPAGAPPQTTPFQPLIAPSQIVQIGPAAGRPPTPLPDTSRSPTVTEVARDDDEPPSVSFPSIPPKPERTPPYGSRPYDAAAAEVAASYRIAPPAEEAFRARDRRSEPGEAASMASPVGVPHAPPSANGAPSVPPAEPPPRAPGDVRTTLTSASFERPSLVRRNSRPSLAAVPYPAPAPPPPPPPPEDDGEPPAPVRRRRVRAPNGGPTLEALRRASSRDEVIRLAMRGMRLTARRLAVFAVRRDGFYGWSCNVEMGDEQALRSLYIPSDVPSILATATATALYLGPIPSTPAHEGLLAVVERTTPDVAAVAVRVAGRAVLVLVCDEVEDTMVSTRFLAELAKAVGEALARLIAR